MSKFPNSPSSAGISAIMYLTQIRFLLSICVKCIIWTFPFEDLENQAPGRNYPYRTMFEGIGQHTIDHSGRVAIIPSILRSQS